MNSTPPADFKKIAGSLGETLDALRKAAKRKASAQDQLAAFQLGCRTLTQLVATMETAAAGLQKLEGATATVAVHVVPGKPFKKFVEAELDLLRDLKFTSEAVEDAEQRLKALGKEGNFENLAVDSKETMEALKAFRDILCGIEKLNAKGRAVSPELVSLCLDGALDSVLIVGDVASVIGGVAAGPAGWGAVLLAGASVAGGVRSLRKVIAKARELLEAEKRNQEAGEIADENRRRMLRHPRPKKI